MIRKLLNTNIFRYFVLAIMATAVDVLTAYFLFQKARLGYIFASNVGMIAGMIFQYATSMKYVFQVRNNLTSFTIYIATFIIGIGIADLCLWISFDKIKLDFIQSKMISIILPFFFNYYFRKRIYSKLLDISLNKRLGEQ